MDSTDRHLPPDPSRPPEGAPPAEDTPAEDTPAEDTPAEDTPAEGTPADGERRDRLVADPTLAARFTSGRPRPRGRRFVASYPGAVAAAACLAALAVVVGIRALTTEGSPAVASAGPAAVAPPTRPAPVGPTPSSVGSATPVVTPTADAPVTPTTDAQATPVATGTSPGSPTATGPAPGAPLTSPVRSGAPAPTGLQAAAGAALVRNPALRVAAQARGQLLAGLVDVRLSTVLATVAAQTALTVDSFQSVREDPAGSPVRQATVAATDPAARGAVTRALSDQAGDYAVATAPAAAAGLQTVRLRTVARP